MHFKLPIAISAPKIPTKQQPSAIINTTQDRHDPETLETN